jgi:hypothetical protein
MMAQTYHFDKPHEFQTDPLPYTGIGPFLLPFRATILLHWLPERESLNEYLPGNPLAAYSDRRVSG